MRECGRLNSENASRAESENGHAFGVIERFNTVTHGMKCHMAVYILHLEAFEYFEKRVKYPLGNRLWQKLS